MNMKFAVALVASTLAFSVHAESSESAEAYVEARYGTSQPEEIYDTNIKHKHSSQHHTDVGVGRPADHEIHMIERRMGAHD